MVPQGACMHACRVAPIWTPLGQLRFGSHVLLAVRVQGGALPVVVMGRHCYCTAPRFRRF